MLTNLGLDLVDLALPVPRLRGKGLTPELPIVLIEPEMVERKAPECSIGRVHHLHDEIVHHVHDATMPIHRSRGLMELKHVAVVIEFFDGSVAVDLVVAKLSRAVSHNPIITADDVPELRKSLTRLGNRNHFTEADHLGFL